MHVAFCKGSLYIHVNMGTLGYPNIWDVHIFTALTSGSKLCVHVYMCACVCVMRASKTETRQCMYHNYVYLFCSVLNFHKFSLYRGLGLQRNFHEI